MKEIYKLLAFPLTFATIVLAFFVLIVWQQLLLPMVLAIVIWYLIITLANTVGRIPYVGARLPPFLQYMLAFAICIGAGWFVLSLLKANVGNLLQQIPVYQQHFLHLEKRWYDWLGITSPPDFSEMLGRFDLVNIISSFAAIVRDTARNSAIIVVYVLFLLLEHHLFDTKLKALISNPTRLTRVRTLIQQINAQIQRYLIIKTGTSLMTALSSYFILRAVGVDFAEFWALLIFILNFIPTIGSIIATLFPCLLTLIQFSTLTPFIIVTTCLVTVQFCIGNILEPRWMGQAFNLSGLVIILSLAVWGQVWGIAGMFLCVPIMVILNIVLANFSRTRPIAVLLSQDGRIKKPEKMEAWDEEEP